MEMNLWYQEEVLVCVDSQTDIVLDLNSSNVLDYVVDWNKISYIDIGQCRIYLLQGQCGLHYYYDSDREGDVVIWPWCLCILIVYIVYV